MAIRLFCPTMEGVDLTSLLVELSAAPRLPGAACRGRADVFDADTRNHTAVAAAMTICTNCPALDRCRDWLNATPASMRPSGVVAGRVLRAPRSTDLSGWLPAAVLHKPVPSPRRAAAQQFLLDALASGPRRSDELLATAKALGFTRQTVFRAATAVGVTSEPDGRHRIWCTQ